MHTRIVPPSAAFVGVSWLVLFAAVAVQKNPRDQLASHQGMAAWHNSGEEA